MGRIIRTVSMEQVAKDTGVPYESVVHILNGHRAGIPMDQKKKVLEYRHTSGNDIDFSDELFEDKIKQNYFSASNQLREFLSNKYFKYHNKPVQLKPGIYPEMKSRVGFYEGWNIPMFINDASIHEVSIDGNVYCLCENDFTIYKEKIKDKAGRWTKWVDVKCPHCTHADIYNMRYLVWGLNCDICHGVIGVEDRVRKTKFNMRDFR